MTRHALFALLLTCCAARAAGAVANLGPRTLAAARAEAGAAAFKVAFRAGAGAAGAAGAAEVEQAATVGTDAVLGAGDVQASARRVALRAGRRLAAHAHPRAAEAVYVQTGRLDVFFRDGARTVRARVRAGQAAVFPQGLPHGGACVGDVDCIYVAYAPSADPGYVAMPEE